MRAARLGDEMPAYVDTFAPNHVEVVLSPGSVVRGYAVTAKGRVPLPDLVVAVVSNDRRFQTTGWTESIGTTNEDGALEVGGVAPGLHDVVVRSELWVAAITGPIRGA